MKIREIRIVESRGNWDSMLAEDRAEWVATNFKNKLEAAYQSYENDAGKKSLEEKLQKLNRERDFNKLPINAQDIVRELMKADPKNGDNIMAIVNMYAKKQFHLEDVGTIHDELDKFIKARELIKAKVSADPELKAKYRNVTDLNTLSWSDIIALTKLTREESGGPDRAAWADVVKGSKKIIWTDKFKVFTPESEAASQAIRRTFPDDIKWCTTFIDRPCLHNQYANQGPLYTIMYTGAGTPRLWQLHYETGQFMDEANTPINQADISTLSKIPEYTDFLNCMIVKYYSKYLPPEETKGKCKYPV